jgi:hypothetical protein
MELSSPVGRREKVCARRVEGEMESRFIACSPTLLPVDVPSAYMISKW